LSDSRVWPSSCFHVCFSASGSFSNPGSREVFEYVIFLQSLVNGHRFGVCAPLRVWLLIRCACQRLAFLGVFYSGVIRLVRCNTIKVWGLRLLIACGGSDFTKDGSGRFPPVLPPRYSKFSLLTFLVHLLFFLISGQCSTWNLRVISSPFG